MTTTKQGGSDQLVYECDLCSATSEGSDTLDLHRVTLSETNGDLYIDLCFVCRDSIMGTPEFVTQSNQAH